LDGAILKEVCWISASLKCSCLNCGVHL
jgi:hypothetical protein